MKLIKIMNKQSIVTILLIMFVSMFSANTFAYDIAVQNADGVTIYYNYINEGKELEVTYRFYPSNSDYDFYRDRVVIPDEVSYMNRNRKVTSIGTRAFWNCKWLTSITISKYITSISDDAFQCCSGLTSIFVEEGNSV